MCRAPDLKSVFLTQEAEAGDLLNKHYRSYNARLLLKQLPKKMWTCSPECFWKEYKECVHQHRGKHLTKALPGIFKSIYDTESHCSLPTGNTTRLTVTMSSCKVSPGEQVLHSGDLLHDNKMTKLKDNFCSCYRNSTPRKLKCVLYAMFCPRYLLL